MRSVDNYVGIYYTYLKDGLNMKSTYEKVKGLSLFCKAISTTPAFLSVYRTKTTVPSRLCHPTERPATAQPAS